MGDDEKRVHGPDDGLFLRTANTVTKGFLGALSAGMGCVLLFVVLGLLGAIGQCASGVADDMRRNAEMKEYYRLNREHPDLGCRNELRRVREDGTTPMISEFRDTVSAAAFRSWISERLLDGSTSVSVYFPERSSYEESGSYSNCSSELVEEIRTDGTVAYPGDSLVQAFHSLLARRGSPHPVHPVRPDPRRRSYAPAPADPSSAWERCVRGAVRRELDKGEDRTFAAGVAAIECAYLRP